MFSVKFHLIIYNYNVPGKDNVMYFILLTQLQKSILDATKYLLYTMSQILLNTNGLSDASDGFSFGESVSE